MSATPAAGVRLTRLLQLVPWLLAHPGVAVDEASAHFGVTEEQLRADLDLLICSGPGVQHGELLDIWYWEDNRITVKDPQSLTRPLRLTGEEAAALLVGLRVLSQVPGPYDREAVARVSATLEAAAGAVASAGSAVAVDVETRADPEILATVARAVDEGRVLHLRYAGAAADQETERDVDPQSLLTVDGRPYLSGWCRSAGAMRTFRLDRVRAATVLDEQARLPADATGPDLGHDGLRPDGPPAVLDLAPGARWVVEEYPVDKVRDRPDGTTRVTLPVSDQRWILRLLLRLGPSARVVSPKALSRLVVDEATAALDAYS